MNVVGKSTPSKADADVDTVVSPSPPKYALDDAPPAVDPALRLELGGRVSGLGPAKPRESCLSRDEVVAHLGRGCPLELRARVERHAADCSACRRWVQHVGDEILEYIGGQLAEDELARMDAHLDACDACRDLVHHVIQGMGQSSHGERHDTTEPGTTFLPGNLVNGRYMILRFVGRGGMGEVYEAFDQLMDRRIALKTVLCTVADRPRAARRFKEEVRNAQRVGHRHVCRINDLQEHREGAFGPALPFFTMEYIDGERLGNRLAAGPLPLDEARIIAYQLLAGLEAAHARGVLHLDFKSDNVMLRRDSAAPDAVIMDFGLSRVLGKESRLRTSDRQQFAGTLPYMSVEQLECREVLGPTTDVYAFGVVLYEMLTRTLPFDGESLGAVLLEQLRKRPQPPSHSVRELSPALDRFVLACLHNDPSRRYADAGEALVALRAVGSWTRTPSEAWLRQSLPWAAAALGLGLLALANRPREERAKPASVAPVASTPAALQPAPADAPPTSPPPASTGAVHEARDRASSPPQAPGSRADIERAQRAPTLGMPAAQGATEPLTPPPIALMPTPRSSASAAPARTASSAPRTAAATVAAAAATEASADPRETSALPPDTAPRAPSTNAASGPGPAPVSPSAASEARPSEAWKPARVPKRLSVPAASGNLERAPAR